MPRRAVAVLVTCPTRLVGQRIASGLIRQRLAACVNLVPGIESTFWWQGKIERCREVLLVIKTTPACAERLRQTVIRLHPYDVPEVIVLPITGGHLPYLRWVFSSVSAR